MCVNKYRDLFIDMILKLEGAMGSIASILACPPKNLTSFFLKSESKKIGHFLLLIIWYWEPSEYFWIKKGQNDLFQALKWGIVCLSTSNGSRDMTKRNNSIIWNFHDLV